MADELKNMLTRIHGEHFIVAKQMSHVVGILSQQVAVKRSRSKSQPLHLINHHINDSGMIVTLINGTVST